MAKKSKRRVRPKDTKSQKRRRKRKMHVTAFGSFHDSNVELKWDPRKTLQQNYAHLGLLADANESTECHSGNKGAGKSETETHKGVLTKDLERIQSLPPPEPYKIRSMNLKEQRTLRKLMAKYGDDYERMSRDISINVWQKTANELARRIKVYESLLNG